MTAAIWSDISAQRPGNWPGLGLVLLLHVSLIWASFHVRHQEKMLELGAPLMVRFIQAPPAPEPEQVEPPQPEPMVEISKPREKPKPRITTRAETPRPVVRKSRPVQRVQSKSKPKTIAKPRPPRSSPASETTSEAPLVPPDVVAAYRNNPPPVYPSHSRKLGESGSVMLRVHVTHAGHADQVKIHRSSGFRRLDRAAVDAVRRWKFAPAHQGSRAVAAWVLVPIEFELTEG